MKRTMGVAAFVAALAWSGSLAGAQLPPYGGAAELRAELRLTRRLSSVPHNSVDLSQNPTD